MKLLGRLNWWDWKGFSDSVETSCVDFQGTGHKGFIIGMYLGE